MELRKTALNVVTVYPGPVKTPMADRNWALVKQTASTKLAPIGDADELAHLIVRAVDKRKARIIYPSAYKTRLVVTRHWTMGRGAIRPRGHRRKNATDARGLTQVAEGSEGG